ILAVLSAQSTKYTIAVAGVAISLALAIRASPIGIVLAVPAIWWGQRFSGDDPLTLSDGLLIVGALTAALHIDWRNGWIRRLAIPVVAFQLLLLPSLVI